MRVAFFVWRFPMASETFVLNLAKAVIDAGHTLDIYSLRTGGEKVLHPLIARYRLEEHHIKANTPENALLRLLAAPGALARAVSRHGLRALNVLPGLSFSRRALTLRPLFEAAAIRPEPYDIVHCQFSSLAPVILRLRDAGILSGRLVVHVRGTDITKEVRRSGRNVYRRAFAEAAAVIANSRHFRDAALAVGCPPEKAVVIPSSTDLTAFPYRDPTPPQERTARLIAVGRLVEKKGYPFAIDAIARLVASGRDVTLDIIGAGPLEATLRARTAAAGLAERVRFHGAQPSDAVQRALAASDIFLAASVTAPNGDQDAATNTVKEAMATGLPVVATRHGGMPEMVIDGETGLLAREGDAGDLAAQLARLIDAPGIWAPLARAARAKVETETASTVLDQRLIALYEKIATSPVRTP